MMMHIDPYGSNNGNIWYLKPIYPDMLLAILYRSDCISI